MSTQIFNRNIDLYTGTGELSASAMALGNERRVEWSPIDIDRGNNTNGYFSFYRSHSSPEDLELGPAGNTTWNYIRLNPPSGEDIQYVTESPFTTGNCLDSSGQFLYGDFVPPLPPFDWYQAENKSMNWITTVEMMVEWDSPIITDNSLLIYFITETSGTVVFRGNELVGTIYPVGGSQFIRFQIIHTSIPSRPILSYISILNPNGKDITLKTSSGRIKLKRFGQAGLITGKNIS